MKSKYFAVKTRKQVTGGRIKLDMEARYFEAGQVRDDFLDSQQGGGAGWRAHIFNKATDMYLRSSGRWDDEKVGGESFHFAINTTYHDTGAEASRWIERVRQHLHKLDTHHDHMFAECAALEG